VLDTDTETNAQLVMSRATRDDLLMRATVALANDSRADAFMRALATSTAIAGGYRVTCDDAALAFIRDAAPEIARYWPAVFGEVQVPRSNVLAVIAHSVVGQTVAGVHVAPAGAVRVEFESGDALTFDAPIIDGLCAIDWEARGEPTDAQMREHLAALDTASRAGRDSQS
jgi:hypothetical protein